eukprot:s477_g16.t1
MTNWFHRQVPWSSNVPWRREKYWVQRGTGLRFRSACLRLTNPQGLAWKSFRCSPSMQRADPRAIVARRQVAAVPGGVPGRARSGPRDGEAPGEGLRKRGAMPPLPLGCSLFYLAASHLVISVAARSGIDCGRSDTACVAEELALLQHQLAAGEEHGGMVEGDDKVQRWRRRQRPRRSGGVRRCLEEPNCVMAKIRRWRSRNYKVDNYKAYYYGKQTTTTRIATTTTTVSTAPPTGMWLLANAQDRCDELCKFNGYGRCGAAEIAGINSTQAVAALMLQEFNITCNTDPNRNEDFGIFYASNDDCWFVDGTVDCSQGLSNVGRRPVCYCEGTTSTTTPDAGWAFGEDQDSCNDFCRFTGFDGCNASMIQEINTYPRAVRLIEGLGMNLTCDAAIRQKDTGVFINPSNIDPFFAQCFSVKGTVDCDVGFSSLKPLCFCSSTTVTTTLSVNWQLGSVGQTCNDLCTNGFPTKAHTWSLTIGFPEGPLSRAIVSVDDLRTKQVASTTTYLQELGTLRSHLRQVAAAESHLRAMAAETPAPTPSQSKRGSKTDPSSQNSHRRPSVLKKPSKNSVPTDRRASFSETKEEIAIPQGRKFSTMTGAATAAMAFARAQGFGSNAPSEHDVAEVGIEFAEVHHYMWDAAEFLDQATQVLVCKVITEKLRCFKTQKEATTIAELAHLCRRMESYLKGTALEDHEKELKEVRMKLYAREEEASSLVERLQVETAQYEQKERSYIGKLQQQERLRDSLQRELVDTQAQLAAMTAKSQELANELTVHKDAEASMKKQSAAFAKSRARILNVQKSSEDGSESSLEDFFARMLPDLVQHLTKEMKDQSLKNQFTPIVKSLHQIWKSSRAKSQKTAAALEDAEREAAESSKKLEELEGARQKEKDAADAKVQSMKDRAERAEKNIVELQSNFMDNLRQAPAYVSLREDYEICRCELEQTIKQLRAVQEEYEANCAEQEAGWAKQAEDHREQVQKLQNDLREVVESQLHPTQVAQLRADLKRAQHESQALTNTNNMLKDSLAALQKKQRQRVVVGPMVFTSDFDSGNMGHVELLEDAPFVSLNCQPTASQLEYVIDIAPDCAGTDHENGCRARICL